MKPGVYLAQLQEPAKCTYPESDQTSPCSDPNSLKLLLLLLFSRLYNIFTSSCAHLTIIVSSSSSCLCRIYIYIYYYYLAGCTMFSHLPALI